MATHDERAQARIEIIDRMERTDEADRLNAIEELSEEYGYGVPYITSLCRRNDIKLPRARRTAGAGASRAMTTDDIIEEAFGIVGAYLVQGATYKSVSKSLGISSQRVSQTVKLAREKGVIG